MKPRMQLSDDCPVTPAFRSEINSWMLEFFGYEQDERDEPATTRRLDDANPAPARRPRSQAKKTRKTQTAVDASTLKELLEGLDDSFFTMQVPTLTGSWLTKKEVSAIKKMGVFVPKVFELEIPKAPSIPNGTPLASIATSLFLRRKDDTKDRITPRFAFCIKQPRLPENVEVTRGTAYKFGQCYEIRHNERVADMSPRIFWMWCWIVVRPDGEIYIPHELRDVSSSVIHRRKQSNGRRSTVHTRQWAVPSLATNPDTNNSIEENKRLLACSFRQLLMWWGARQEQWSVGVRKDGHRVTFSVPKEQTSAYFADRDAVVNLDGKPRKIIHFVREHSRSNGSTVKAHVRGLSEFDWHGYRCSVTAPNFNGGIYTSIPLAPVEADELPDAGFLETVEMAEHLADLEDARA